MHDPEHHSARRPTRRTVTKAALWTTPAIVAVAPAPAFAASPCSVTYTGTVSFAPTGNYTRVDYFTGSALVNPSPGTDPLLVSFSSVTDGYNRDQNANFTKNATLNEFSLQQTRQVGIGSTSSNAQTLTIGFARPVTNLTFVIDGFTQPVNSPYTDTVYTSPPPTSFVNGANVVGAGTPSSPFKPRVLTLDGTPFTGPTVSTTVTYAGPLTALTLVYWSSSPTTVTPSIQAIYLGNMTFNLKPTGCS